MSAARYVPEGTEIELVATASKGAVTIEVLDSGPGIPEADRTRVFEASTAWTSHGRVRAAPGSDWPS